MAIMFGPRVPLQMRRKPAWKPGSLPGGAAGAATYTFKQPGLYAYVNHNLIEAFMKGAAAHFQVDGEWDDDLMTQVKEPSPI